MPRARLVLRHTFLICTESIFRLEAIPGLPTAQSVVETAVGRLDEARLSGETWIGRKRGGGNNRWNWGSSAFGFPWTA
jgi:hypothetical protein